MSVAIWFTSTPHSTAIASFSSCEYLFSVSIKALDRYVTGLYRLAWGSYCFSVTAKPWSPASVMSSVFRWGTKYALPCPLTVAFWFAQTLSGTQVSTVKVPPV